LFKQKSEIRRQKSEAFSGATLVSQTAAKRTAEAKENTAQVATEVNALG
jgi:hypothetical protein